MGLFILLMAAFVLTHIGLATPPVRDGLVVRLGETGFRVGYSLLSLALLIGAVQVYQKLPEDALLWTAGVGAYHVANLLMLLASILFVGSLTPANRALAGVPPRPGNEGPSGVLRWTRHPMMWAFGLWAFVHGWLAGDAPTLVLAGGIGTLALVGAAFQDGKKARQLGADWKMYQARTSFVPFAAILAGKQPLSALWPGLVPVVGGVLFWLVLTFLHPSLIAAPMVGIWQFV
ncbi:NnrU family protein [Thermaurantiacus sp.]